MTLRYLKIGLLLLTIQFVSGCISTGEPQLIVKNEAMSNKNVLYSQCETDHPTQSNITPSTPTLDPENISLLNWNIYKGKLDNWEKDLHNFINDIDIVTIQEAHLNYKLKSVLHNNDYQWTLNAAFHLNNIPAGVMTASRIPALDTCGLRHIEPLIRTHKTTLVSYYPIEGFDKNLLVANIHGINFTLGTYAYKKQIKHLFDIVNQHEGPVLIAGDFNTWSHARKTVMFSYVDSAKLTSLDYTNHNRTHVFGHALDHVFFRGLDPIKHHSWQVNSSDHNPTSVSFKVL